MTGSRCQPRSNPLFFVEFECLGVRDQIVEAGLPELSPLAIDDDTYRRCTREQGIGKRFS